MACCEEKRLCVPEINNDGLPHAWGSPLFFDFCLGNRSIFVSICQIHYIDNTSIIMYNYIQVP